MDDLRHGVMTFQRHVYPHKKALFRRLAAGQTPKALFITCADSRVDPMLITNSQPGQLFVDRNPGNFIPPYHGDNASEAAGIEYALEVLHIPNIVICGHTDCGAMKGVLHPEKAAALKSVTKWLTNGKESRLAMSSSGCASRSTRHDTNGLQPTLPKPVAGPICVSSRTRAHP